MADKAESSGSSELEAMMAELGLQEDDLQDVIVEEDELPEEATRWMAIARVHTDKTYSQYWFFRNMRVAWDLAQEVKIKPLEENLYTLQFSCLGDWERVMEDGPWNFKGKAVVMAHYDGFTKPSMIDLTKLDIWMQIHDLPDGFFPKIKALSATVGEFIFAEPRSQDFEGNFARVRVKIDVTKPLKNVVFLVVRRKETLERVIFRVKYERLPDWCAVCGYLGH